MIKRLKVSVFCSEGLVDALELAVGENVFKIEVPFKDNKVQIRVVLIGGRERVWDFPIDKVVIQKDY